MGTFTRGFAAVLLLWGCRTGEQAERKTPAATKPAEGTADTNAGKDADANLSRSVPRGTGRPDRRWYAKTELLYKGIPTEVRFTPKDPALARRVWDYLRKVDRVFNAYKPSSEVGRINAAKAPATIDVSGELAGALSLAMKVHRLTGGAFDITVGPVRRLWQQCARTGTPPTRKRIAEALKGVGADKIRLHGRKLSVTGSGLKLDFGGIVKGMAVDRVIGILRKGGATAAYVQLGGEIGAYGISRHGRTHQLGVQHPLRGNKIWTAVRDPGTGISAAVSGNFFNPVRIGNRIYYHIVDPRTGMPADTHILSVNVVFTRTGANGLADGLSTASAVMGPEKAVELIRRMGGEALILVKKGDRIAEHKTPGWDRLAIGRKDPAGKGASVSSR